MKAVVVTDQQQQQQRETISLELSCNSDLVRTYDVLKAVPMGHKDKFYQRILSDQRQTSVDVSQSLPNSLHGDVEHAVELNGGNNAIGVEFGHDEGVVGQGENGVGAGQDGWFNTWPERCEKGETGKTSPRGHNHLSNNTRQIASKSRDNNHQSNSTAALSNGRKVSLNEALQNISLAYSPVTKKLHLITRTTNEQTVSRQTDQNEHEQLLAEQNVYPDKSITDNSLSNDKTLVESLNKESSAIMNNEGDVLKKTHRRIQAGSYSSTVSSISDISPSGSLLDTDTDNISDCSDIGFAKSGKKKGLMQFFNRNVFTSWKSNGSTTTVGVWNLFNNKVSADANASLESPKHEAIVASSSALIQLKRPSNLPAKTVEEEQKHREEYEAMVVAAKRKEALNSVARQKQQKHQLILEEQQAASTKHFLHTVLPNWEATRNLRKTRDLWWQGLPSSVRGRVWRKAIGNDLNITSQLYEICLARAQNLLHSDSNRNRNDFIKNKSFSSLNISKFAANQNIDDESVVNSRKNSGASIDTCGTPTTTNKNDFESFSGSRKSSLNESKSIKQSPSDLYGKNTHPNSVFGSDSSSLMSRRFSLSSDYCTGVLSVDQQQQANLAAVQLDIARVFPNLCIFQEGGPYSDVLHSLLAAYVCYRPDVGYVQGMAYLAAILTLNLQPTHSFIAFANVLNRPLHVAAYTLDEGALIARYRTFERCLAAQLPKLCAHMAAANLTPDLYLLDWVYTVYAKAMPLDVASRVWDVWLRDGEEEFVFRTALGILHLYQDQLLTMDFLHGSQFLTRLPEDLSSEQLFRSIRLVNTTVGKQTFAQIVHSFTQSEYSNS